jgi:hypothetical protein
VRTLPSSKGFTAPHPDTALEVPRSMWKSQVFVRRALYGTQRWDGAAVNPGNEAGGRTQLGGGIIPPAARTPNDRFTPAARFRARRGGSSAPCRSWHEVRSTAPASAQEVRHAVALVRPRRKSLPPLVVLQSSRALRDQGQALGVLAVPRTTSLMVSGSRPMIDQYCGRTPRAWWDRRQGLSWRKAAGRARRTGAGCRPTGRDSRASRRSPAGRSSTGSKVARRGAARVVPAAPLCGGSGQRIADDAAAGASRQA